MSDVQTGKLGVLLAAALTLALVGCGGGNDTADSAPVTYTVGGTITGLSAPGLVLTNGSDTVSPAANATTFVFATALVGFSSYNVSIKTQPKGQTCTLSAGSGTLGASNVADIGVSCLSPWVWQGGSEAINAPPVYGTQGVAAAANTPGSRDGAASWTDASGNVWLLGGITANGTLADLWRFSPTTGLWTWVGGFTDANAPGVYGTQGVASAGNGPGSRSGAATWTDAAGNLWLFGGGGDGAQAGGGYFNDLWRYSITTGQWTWVGGTAVAFPYGAGNISGTFGTQGVAAAGNLPPARSGGSAWRDGSGNLWLFGGEGNAATASISASALMNDLWMYSTQSGLWTWLNGSNLSYPDGTGSGTYGTLGTAAAGNVPSAREGGAAWTDASGNLWLFGGQFAVTGQGAPLLNDLWKFDPTTMLWGWMSGSTPGADAPLSSPQGGGTYGSEGTPAAANVPGQRANSGAWTDAAGNLWLFGGVTPGSNPDVGFTTSNDLWSYDPTSGQWTWVSGSMVNGSNAVGSYGTLHTAAVGITPPGRSAPITFLDGSGNLWLFGGVGWPHNSYSDLWEFKVLPTTP